MKVLAIAPFLRGLIILDPDNWGPRWTGFDFEAGVRMPREDHE